MVDLVVPEPTTLTVEVLDADGQPCADEWIGAARAIPRAEPTEAPTHPLEGHFDPLHLLRGGTYRTDDDGRCVIEGLCPGRWTVYTNLVNEWTHVDLGAGERRSVRLEKGGALAITGRVLHPDGTPYAGHQVVLQGSRHGMGRTDEEGRFTFENLQPGDYRIWIPAIQRARAWTTSSPCAPASTRTSGFRSPARLRIRVEGPRAADVEYSLMTTVGGHDPQDTGFAALDPVSGVTNPFTPGPGLLLVRAQGFGWTAVRFDAVPGRTTDVRVPMRRAGTVRVRVTNARSEKAWHVRLKRLDDFPAALIAEDEKLEYLVGRARGSANESISPDEQGSFESTDVPPANVRGLLRALEPRGDHLDSVARPSASRCARARRPRSSCPARSPAGVGAVYSSSCGAGGCPTRPSGRTSACPGRVGTRRRARGRCPPRGTTETPWSMSDWTSSLPWHLRATAS